MFSTKLIFGRATNDDILPENHSQQLLPGHSTESRGPATKLAFHHITTAEVPSVADHLHYTLVSNTIEPLDVEEVLPESSSEAV